MAMHLVLKPQPGIQRLTLCQRGHSSPQEVVDDPSGNKMLLVMDYMEGGPVMTREALERGRCIPESLACQYFRDMCKASSQCLTASVLALCLHAMVLLYWNTLIQIIE